MGVINYNQVELYDTSLVGDFVTMTVTNDATLSHNTGGSQTVGTIESSQLVLDNPFQAGNSFTLSVSNNATNEDLTGSNNQVGCTFGYQALFNDVVFGDDTNIILTNTAINNGASTAWVGYLSSAGQISYNNLYAGNNFFLTATNSGTDTSMTNASDNVVASATQQVQFSDPVHLGDNASIIVSNEGLKQGNATNAAIAELITGQVRFGSTLNAGNNFTMTVSNTGTSTGSGDGNHTAYTNNGSNGHQVFFSDNVVLGSYADITITNRGVNEAGSVNIVGCIQKMPFYASNNFFAGDNFSLTDVNSGLNTSSGTGNYVGSTNDGYEAYFRNNVVLGNYATITISNEGTYTGTDSGSYVGFTEDQYIVGGIFDAGKNFTLSVTNMAVNPNALPGVGVTINQILFFGSCTLQDGSVISAVNSGNGQVGGSQIYFNDTLTTLGTVTLQAVNAGTVGGTGISLVNSFGGDLNIVVEGSSLYVNNSGIAVPITLASLSGNGTASATCARGFIINSPYAGW